MTVEKLIELVNNLIKCENAEDAEWTYENKVMPALFEDYNVTINYLKQINKDQMIELAGGMEELVEHFNSKELLTTIKERFYSLVGNDATSIDKNTIDNLDVFLRHNQ